jgi:imidazolonepropionase-like amidohydrolase
VRDGLNPASVRIPVARAEGVTTALTVPSGGLVPGQAMAIDLAGDGVLDMEITAPVAMVVTLGEGSKNAGGGTRAGEYDRLRSLFRDAREYQRRQADYRRGAIQPLSAPAADLEALLPVLRGEIPVLATVRRRSDIEATLRLAQEFSLHLVILGGNEAWQVAPALAAAGVPVIVDPYANIPTFDGLATRYDNAALLNQAGVPVLIYETESGGARDLRFAVGQAIRYGLPRDAALRSVTGAVADAFGLAGYGRIAPGAVADVILWDGDPFDFSGAPARIFIRGREVSRENRQTELRDRYRTLPPSY